MSNSTAMRCTECGQVEMPVSVGPGPAWMIVALWIAVALVWATGFLLSLPWLFYLAALLFLGVVLYTLRYFRARELACRHCGSRSLESTG